MVIAVLSELRLLSAASAELAPSGRIGDAWRTIADVHARELRGERDRMRELLATTAEPLARTERPGHLTGSAFVVDAYAERALILFHTKLQIWVQPGGHADGDANLAAVALREAEEETGIDGLRIWPVALDLDTHQVETPKEEPHVHHDVRFLAIAPPGAVIDANDESEEQRWVTFEELGALGVDNGLARMAASGFALASRLLE